MQQLQATKHLLGTSLVPGAELEDENPAVGPGAVSDCQSSSELRKGSELNLAQRQQH